MSRRFSSFGITVPPNDPSGPPSGGVTSSVNILPNTLRIDNKDTISTLRFRESTYENFYLTEQLVSYTSQNVNTLTDVPSTNVISNLCPILDNSKHRKIVVTSKLNSLYIVPIRSINDYYVFGTPVTFPTIRTVLYNSPAYYLTNIGIDNVIVPNVTTFDTSFLDTPATGQQTKITSISESIGDILSTNPTFVVGSIGNTKTINLQRVSTSIVHSVTPISVTTSTGQDTLSIYTTVATEFPYRPVVSILTAYTFTPTSLQDGYTFDDTTFTTKYPNYLVFNTNEETAAIVGKVSVGLNGSYFLNSTTTYSGILPTTIYVVPYAMKTYNSEMLVSYASSVITLDVNGYVPPTVEPPIVTPNTNTSMPYIQFQFRRGTTAEWLAVGGGQGPVLASGEIGVDTTLNQFKIGNGVTKWANLPYGGIQGERGFTGPTGPPGDFSSLSATGTVSADYHPIYYSQSAGKAVLKTS